MQKRNLKTTSRGCPPPSFVTWTSNAYQVASPSDKGGRTIESRGLTIISGVALTLFLDLGTDLTIAATTCVLTPYLMRTNEPRSELATNWLQASFTKREDDRFVGGPIRTRRDFITVDPDASPFTLRTITTHLSQTFLPASTPTVRIQGREIFTTQN